MPYADMPPELQGKMEQCVVKVMGQGHDKKAAIAICYTALMSKSAPDEMIDAALKAALDAVKVGQRNSAQDAARLNQIMQLSRQIVQLALDNGAVDMAVEPGENERLTAVAEAAADDVMQQAIVAEGARAYAEAAKMDMRYVKSLHLPDEEMIADLVAVKRIGRDDIQGYLALWGGKDLEGEYFTAKTDFWDKVLALPRPLTWDHAQDGSMKADPIIGMIPEMGDDEIGRWYRATLQRNHEYRRAVDNLISKRAVGTSSDSAPQYIIREPQADGKAVWLKRWPLFAGALTASPCEPRMLDEGALHWKSIAEELPKIALALDGAKGEPDGSALDSADVERLRLWFDYLKLR